MKTNSFQIYSKKTLAILVAGTFMVVASHPKMVGETNTLNRNPYPLSYQQDNGKKENPEPDLGPAILPESPYFDMEDIKAKKKKRRFPIPA